MARGWESKSIEEQIEATREAKNLSEKNLSKKLGKAIPKADRSSPQRELLLLARTRILKDIETTENLRYKQLLETSLAAIEGRLLEMK